jgi:hypothetical protein
MWCHIAQSTQASLPIVCTWCSCALSCTLHSGIPCSYRMSLTLQAVMVLQAMQRLVTSHPAADALLSTPGLVGRLWVCYSSGCDDHVATEAGRTMLRLFSPRAARKGAGQSPDRWWSTCVVNITPEA